MGALKMTNEFVQTMSDARVDARSLSDFVFKPAGFKVARRLAPPVDTLQFYINRFNSLNGDFSSSVSVALSSLNNSVAEAQGKVAYIESTVQDAINNTAVEGGVLADTFVTVTANGTGSVARTQRDKNNDVPSIKDFANAVDAQAAAISQGIKIFIPTGEHTYNITNADMTLFWGYGQLKDSVTGAIYKPKNGDFITPEMFGIREKVDETVKLQSMIEYAFINNKEVVWQGGKEYWFDSLRVRGDGGLKWTTSGSKALVLRSIKSEAPEIWGNDYAIDISMDYIGIQRATSHAGFGSNVISVEDASVFKVGEVCELRSTRLIEADNRGQSREGQTMRIRAIDGNTLIFDRPIRFYNEQWSYEGAINSVNSQKELVLPSAINRTKNRMLLRLEITSGADSGRYRYITDWDNSTKVATIGGQQSGFSDVKAGDTFKVEWYVSVTNIRCPDVDINGNFHLVRDETLDATDGQEGFIGLSVGWAKSCKVKGVKVENFSEMGQRYTGCFEPVVEDCHSFGANRAFSVSGNPSAGTGYGFAEAMNYGAKFTNCTAQRCRRGFDSGGTQQTSWNTQYINCSVYGGGLTYEGIPFFPNGSVFNSGMGTHGGGYNIELTGCKIYDVMQGFSHRAKDTTVRNCAQYGLAERCHQVYYASGLLIDGFEYNDGITSLNKGRSESYQGRDLNEKRAEHFMVVWADQAREDTPIIVKNTTSTALRGSFIHVERDGTCPALMLGNNTAVLNNEGYGGMTWAWVTKDSTSKLQSVTEVSANVKINVEYPHTVFGDSAYDVKSLFPEGGVVQKTDGKYLLHIKQNTVQKVYVGGVGMLDVSLYDVRGSRPFYARSVLIDSAGSDFTIGANGNKNLVEVLSEKPNGTTVGTSGYVGLSLRPEGGSADRSLHIQNRWEQDIVILLTVRQ